MASATGLKSPTRPRSAVAQRPNSLARVGVVASRSRYSSGSRAPAPSARDWARLAERVVDAHALGLLVLLLDLIEHDKLMIHPAGKSSGLGSVLRACCSSGGLGPTSLAG